MCGVSTCDTDAMSYDIYIYADVAERKALFNIYDDNRAEPGPPICRYELDIYD